MKQWSYVFLLYIFTVDSASVDSKHGHDRVVSDRKLSHKEHFHGEDHDFDYDHEAFLGADEAREFDQLPPEESRARLGKIVDKIGNVQVFVNLTYSFCTLGGASRLFVYKQSSLGSQFSRNLISIDFLFQFSDPQTLLASLAEIYFFYGFCSSIFSKCSSLRLPKI